MTKLCATAIILLCVVFETATPQEVDWTLVDQEGPYELEETAESGSGESSGSGDGHQEQESQYKWLAHHRSGHIHVSSSKEVADMLEYVAHSRCTTDGRALVSYAPTQLEDGPTKLVGESDKRLRTSPLGETALPAEPQEEQLDEIDSTNFYPQYGVGMLESGCTAFLVGPRHALTTASCVYNYSAGNWNRELDFWRGRNGDEYLEKMVWVHVIIPAKFFVTNDYTYNWALIVFGEETESKVWLKMASSPDLSDIKMTVYGYLTDNHPWGKMYSAVCHSDSVQYDASCLTIQCETNQKFSGGPILKGYNFQHSKMPLVYGISTADDYSSNMHKAVRFHPALFWSLCHHLTREGFDAKCGVQ